MKYKTPWEPYSLNKPFWEEVLKGRTITDLVFDSQGIDYLLLDNGEKLYPDKKEQSCRFSLEDVELNQTGGSGG